jgi:hypothetical protein
MLFKMTKIQIAKGIADNGFQQIGKKNYYSHMENSTRFSHSSREGKSSRRGKSCPPFTLMYLCGGKALPQMASSIVSHPEFPDGNYLRIKH